MQSSTGTWCLWPAVCEGISEAVRSCAEVGEWVSDLQEVMWARGVDSAGEKSGAATDAFEREVLAEIRNGEQDRFREIVERYQGEISRRMWRFTRVARDHEELVQEVFVQAYFSLKNYRGEAAFVNWLQRIATRTGYRYWKERKSGEENVRLIENGGELTARVDPQDAQNDAAEVLEILMRRLSPEDRLVVTLLHLEEYSVAEIAVQTGWSESNVKVRAHRARGKLAVWLEERNHEQQ